MCEPPDSRCWINEINVSNVIEIYRLPISYTVSKEVLAREKQGIVFHQINKFVKNTGLSTYLATSKFQHSSHMDVHFLVRANSKGK